jgi:PAS domain S-box-containing protein
MKTNFSQKLIFLSLLVLSSVGFIGYASYQSHQRLLDSEQWVQHTERVIDQSAKIFALTKDIDLAAESYVITIDTAFLEAGTASNLVFASIAKLRQLTLDNPSQQEREDSLIYYTRLYVNFALRTVEIRNKKGLASAVTFILSKQGKRYADRISQVTIAIQQEENTLLKQRIQTNKRSVAAFELFSVVVLIIMSAFAILLLISLGKYFLQIREKARRAAELVVANKELAFQNQEKGKRAKELVIANQEILFQSQIKEKAGQERAQSEIRLARVQLVAHMGSWELSLDTYIVTCSEEACRIYGIPTDQNKISFETWVSFIFPEDVEFVLDKIKKSRDSMLDFSFFHRIVCQNDIIRHVYLESRLEFDLDLKPTALFGIVHDVTEIRLAEEKSDFDRNNLAALINNTDDMMWSIDNDLNLITFNDAFDNAMMIAFGKPLAKGDYMLSPKLDKDRISTYKTLYEKALRGDTFTIIDHIKNPAECWLEVSFHPLRNGNDIIGTACFSRDVTRRIESQKAIRGMEREMSNQKVQEQKQITRAIITAQEKERNHIGQELHDNICQILASSKLYLDIAGTRNESTRESVRYPLELVENSIQEIRRLSSRLVTPLKNVDLKELVQSLLIQLRANTDINTVFDYNVGDGDLDDNLKLNIYRIIQEQVNNMVKHASPGKIGISVQAEHRALRIEMKDDGKGFDLKKKRKGIGISNMMNRIDSFNGKMAIRSSPGKGCTIQIAIPY